MWLLALAGACGGGKSEDRPRAVAEDAAVAKKSTIDAGVAKPATNAETIAALPKGSGLDESGIDATYDRGAKSAAEGKLAEGLAQLKQIRDLGCSPCRALLDRARTDPAWAIAWTDSRFQLLTMSATGPFARIVGFGVSGDAAGVAASVELDRLPGFNRVPPLELVVRNHGGEVARTKVDLDRGDAIELPINAVGRYVVELLADGKLAGSHRVVAGKVACAGGEPRLVVRGQVAARLGIEYADQKNGPAESLFVELRRWAPLDYTDTYVVEWRRNGGLVKRETSKDGPSWLSDSIAATSDWYHQFEKPTDFDGCAWPLRTEHYVAPVTARRVAGRWELRVYRYGLPGVSISFTAAWGVPLTSIVPLEKRIETPAAIRAQLERDHGARSAADAALIRAMGRHKPLIALQAAQNRLAKAGRRDAAAQKAIDALVAKHGGPWTAAEWPLGPDVPLAPIGKNTFAPKVRGLRTPMLSPDGRIFAAAIREHLVEPSMQCKSKAVQMVRFFRVGEGELEPIGSRALKGYVPVRCGVTMVHGGVRVARKKTDLGTSFTFLDRAGKELASTEVEAPETGVICAVPRRRLAFLRITDKSDKCASVPRVQYAPVRY